MFKASPMSLKSADYERLVWVHVAEEGVPFEAIEGDTAYWSHIAKHLKADHEIIVRPIDRSYYAHFLVVASDRLWAKVKLLYKVDIATLAKPKEETVPAGYEIKHRGGARWSVIREIDHEVLQEKLASRADAMVWLTNHLKIIAA